MTCARCDAPTVVFVVPPALRAHAPEGAAAAALCTRCLRTAPAAPDEAPAGEPAFDAVLGSFPGGEPGVALALALGKLSSLAIEREAVVALCDRAERGGADVALTLERLAAAGRVEPHYDLDRRRRQLRAFR